MDFLKLFISLLLLAHVNATLTQFTCSMRTCPTGCSNDGTCFCTGGGAVCDAHWNQAEGQYCRRDSMCSSGLTCDVPKRQCVAPATTTTHTPTPLTQFTCSMRACPTGCSNDGTCFCTGGGAVCDAHWNQAEGQYCRRDSMCSSGLTCDVPKRQCVGPCTISAPATITINGQNRDDGVYTLTPYSATPGKAAYKHFRTQSFFNCCESTGKWGLSKFPFTACEDDFTSWRLNTASCSVCDLLEQINKPTTTHLPTPSPTPNFTCPTGYTQIGTLTENNDVAGVGLGQFQMNTIEECKAKCESVTTCKSFGFGHHNSDGHTTCEIDSVDAANNSWHPHGPLRMCKKINLLEDVKRPILEESSAKAFGLLAVLLIFLLL